MSHPAAAMQAPLLEAVCAAENISSAYARFAGCRGLWSPGVPMSRVSAAPVHAVLQLADELRRGRYQPQPAHQVAVRKADGGRRDLHVYYLRDRVAQRALLQVLQPRAEPTMASHSFGYRPGRSVAQAVAAVHAHLDAGLCWVGDADIEQCFDRMTHQRALDAVREALQSDEAASLVGRWMGWPAQPGPQPRGLPQGSVLSPWLCNLYLAPLDRCLRPHGAAMVRFADDFVLMAPTRRTAEEALDLCRRALAAVGLALHPLKTGICHAVAPFRFLGQWLCATPLLPSPPGAARATP